MSRLTSAESRGTLLLTALIALGVVLMVWKPWSPHNNTSHDVVEVEVVSVETDSVVTAGRDSLQYKRDSTSRRRKLPTSSRKSTKAPEGKSRRYLDEPL